jgi:integrase
MASVHKSSKSKYWHGSIRVGGKQVFRSTGETDKGRALAVALAWEEAARGPRPESPAQARRVMEDLLAKVLGHGRGRTTCGEYLAVWLAELKGTVAESTLTFYRGAVGAFVAHVGAGRGIEGVMPEDVVGWRTAEAERVTVKTANQRLKAVRAFFAGAMRAEYIRTNPAASLKPLRPAKEKGVRRPFTRDEIDRVLRVCDPDWRLVVRLGLTTGQRLGDLIRMDWGDLDLAEGVWMVETAKTGLRLVLPLQPELVAELQARQGGSIKGPVFPAMVAEVERSGGYVGGISKAFAHALWLAGLREVNPYGRQPARREGKGSATREQHELSFHSLRHTARTWLEEAGQPRAIIDALIGHSGETGRRYTRVGMDALRAAAAVLGGGKPVASSAGIVARSTNEPTPHTTETAGQERDQPDGGAEAGD